MKSGTSNQTNKSQIIIAIIGGVVAISVAIIANPKSKKDPVINPIKIVSQHVEDNNKSIVVQSVDADSSKIDAHIENSK
ncbi:MAG: hypothetical protein JWN78_1633 [Bacteroidota bacterium]|nr:hypothetical protein [Bacteroidota bacterium]